MEQMVLSILVHNHSGVLNRVASLFSRRAYNIDSLSVGETEDKNTSRITVVTTGEEATLDQIVKQVRKLEDVMEVVVLSDMSAVYRELVLVKVGCTNENRSAIVSIVDIFRAKIVDVSPDSMIIEVTGAHSKIESLLVMLEGFNIIEIVRTGLTGISRGLDSLNINNDD